MPFFIMVFFCSIMMATDYNDGHYFDEGSPFLKATLATLDHYEYEEFFPELPASNNTLDFTSMAEVSHEYTNKRKAEEQNPRRLRYNKCPILSSFLYLLLKDKTFGKLIDEEKGEFTITDFPGLLDEAYKCCGKQTPSSQIINRLKTLKKIFKGVPGLSAYKKDEASIEKNHWQIEVRPEKILSSYKNALSQAKRFNLEAVSN